MDQHTSKHPSGLPTREEAEEAKRKRNLTPVQNKLPKDILHREDWFPTPIYFADHPTEAQTNQKLIKDIDRWYDRDQEGIIRSNSLGWHSAVDMHHRSEYNHFTKWLIEKVNQMMTSMGYHPKFEAFCDNMWANINKRYSHNRNHVHPGALWSGVYYVRAPESSGRIWFTDPRGEAHTMIPRFNTDKNKPKPKDFWREVYYEPTPGRLIVFPGWLTHEVEPNLNMEFKEDDRKGWRYSISFNFVQRYKPGETVIKEAKGHDGGGGVFADDLKETT